MDRDLKQMRCMKQYSPLSIKNLVCLFVIVLQASFCLNVNKEQPGTGVSTSEKNLQKTQSTNLVRSNSDDSGIVSASSTDDLSKENEKVDDQSGNLKEPSPKLENQSKKNKLLLQCKAWWDRFKKDSESSQKKKIQSLSLSEAKNHLESAIQESNVKAVEMLLQYRTNQSDQVPEPFTSQDLLEALNQVVSFENLSKVKEILKIFNILITQPTLSLNDLCVQDEDGITWLHYAAAYGDIHTWEIILDKMPNDFDLCAPDKEERTPLHYLAMPGNAINAINNLKIILPKISVDSLCAEDQAGKTPLHYLALNNEIKDYKLLFTQIKDKLATDPKIGIDRVVKEFLKRDDKRYSVIDYIYLPKSNYSEPNNIKSKFSIHKIKGKSTKSEIFSWILNFLPCVLKDEQLGTIAADIEDRVADGSISQAYANKLCAIIGKYIDKNYGNKAKEVRAYVAYGRHCEK